MTQAAAITLVLGGARSGKSEHAEWLVSQLSGAIVYVATGPVIDDGEDGTSQDWAQRLRRHRDRRPGHWSTLEVAPGGDLASVLTKTHSSVLLDSLGTWVSGLPDFGAGVEVIEADRLLLALEERRTLGHHTVVVSEEVGLGVHPSSAAGLMFRDGLGTLNRRVADIANKVILVVAGRPLFLSDDGSGR